MTQTLHMFHIYNIKEKLKRLILILITVETSKQHLLFQVIQNIYANLILYLYTINGEENVSDMYRRIIQNVTLKSLKWRLVKC